MYVYLVQNKRNGLLYVGQTRQLRPEQRWKQHIYYASSGRYPGVPLATAIREFGADAFEFRLLEKVSDPSVLNRREIWWIRALGTTDPSIGYNVYADWESYKRHVRNIPGTRSKSKLGYFGVARVGRGYRASSSRIDRKKIQRLFATVEEAAWAADIIRATEYGRPIGRLNFPERVATLSDIALMQEFERISKKRGKSRFRGVSVVADGLWRASTRIHYTRVNSIVFATEEDAARAFDIITLFHRGIGYPHINFPELVEEYVSLGLPTEYQRVMARRPRTTTARGISYDKTYGRWRAKCCGKHIGVFKAESAAIEALNAHRATHDNTSFIPPMHQYCSSGHRVAYTLNKPAKCPTCGTDMNPKPKTTVAAASTSVPGYVAPARQQAAAPNATSEMDDLLARYAAAPSKGKPDWMQMSPPKEIAGRLAQEEGEGTEGVAAIPARTARAAADFGIEVTLDEGEEIDPRTGKVRRKNMTIGELKESGEAVVRQESRASAPEGNQSITAADLVRQMTQQS